MTTKISLKKTLLDKNVDVRRLRRLIEKEKHPQTNENYSQSIRSSSSRSRTDEIRFPVVIEYLICFDEKSIYPVFDELLRLSPSLIETSDDFHCNLLMYSLRYERHRLFRCFLQFELNFLHKDQQGNTILHYAVIYLRDHQIDLLKILLEKFRQFHFSVDQRNEFGFTPLLLAMFSGRYAMASIFLRQSDSSAFVRDFLQLKNVFDYVEIDSKTSLKSLEIDSLDIERLRYQIDETIPQCQRNCFRRNEKQISKNFFEIIFSQLKENFFLIRSIVENVFHRKSSSDELNQLFLYLHDRYPTIHLTNDYQSISIFPIPPPQRQSSKENLHQILNFYDPEPRSRAILPPPPSAPPPSSVLFRPWIDRTTSQRSSLTFRRLSTRVSLVNVAGRPSLSSRSSTSSLLSPNVK